MPDTPAYLCREWSLVIVWAAELLPFDFLKNPKVKTLLNRENMLGFKLKIILQFLDFINFKIMFQIMLNKSFQKFYLCKTVSA